MTAEDKMMRYSPLLAGAVSIIFFYFTFTSQDLVAGFTSDDAVYLLLADLYSFRHGAGEAVYDQIRQQSYFPPVYPLLLGLLGGGSGNLALAAHITVAFLLTGIFISGIWIWKVTGSLTPAVTITMLIIFLPGTLIFSQELWSEFPFMALLYGTLLLAGREPLTGREWLAMAVLAALASLTRTAGVSLIAAFWLILLTRRVKPGLAYAAVSAAPFVLYSIAGPDPAGSHGYFDTLSVSAADLSIENLLVPVSVKIVSLFNSLLWLFTSIETGPLHHLFSIIMLMLFLLIAALGLATRLKPARLDVLFFTVYLAMVFLWPYTDVYYVSRFLFPLLPLVFLYLFLGVSRLVNGRKYAGPVLALSVVSIIIVSWPSTSQFVQRAYADVPAGMEPYRRDRTWLLAQTEAEAIMRAANTRFILDTLHTIRDTIPEDGCLYTIQAPVAMLHAKRITGVLPPPESSDAQFAGEIQKCDYILAMPVTDAGGRYPEHYPLRRLNLDQYTFTTYYVDPGNTASAAIVLLTRIVDTFPSE
jgi:hypothetical protein